MTEFLTPQERADLRLRHRKERDRRIADRIKAVLLRDKGWSYEQIAAALLLDDNTVRVYVDDYRREAKLAPENGGSVSRLDATQTAEIIAHLTEKTYLKIKDIVAYIAQHYGITYSISGMESWLKRQKFSFHQPAIVPAKADAAKQTAWLAHYQQLKNHLPEEDHILFADGVHPTHAVRPVCGWIPRGMRKALPTNGSQKRLNLLGALNLGTMTLMTEEFETIDAESTIKFLKILQEKIPIGTIHLVLDQARYNTCKAVKAYVANSRIRLHHLPPYSPNLNAIEPCWKVMHEHVTYNQYYATFKEFSAAIRNFFESTFPAHAKNWVDKLTDNFRIIHSPLLLAS